MASLLIYFQTFLVVAQRYLYNHYTVMKAYYKLMHHPICYTTMAHTTQLELLMRILQLVPSGVLVMLHNNT